MDDVPGIARTSFSFNSAEMRVFPSGFRVAVSSVVSSFGEAMVAESESRNLRETQRVTVTARVTSDTPLGETW